MASLVQALRNSFHAKLSSKYLVANDDLIDFLFIAWLSNGNILLEGPPGTGKTLAAKIFARALAKSFRRVQLNDEVTPADLIGSSIFNPASQSFHFVKGPIFADVVMLDELNLAPLKTQSALVEAMEEKQVTVGGNRFDLSSEFFVIATLNSQEKAQSRPLAESQNDRFLFKIKLDHGSLETDASIIRGNLSGQLPPQINEVKSFEFDRDQVADEIASVSMNDEVLAYITRILSATREHPKLFSGASVRAGIGLAKAARVVAALVGRDQVSIDDVQFLAAPVLRHRLALTKDAQASGQNIDMIIEEIVKKTV